MNFFKETDQPSEVGWLLRDHRVVCVRAGNTAEDFWYNLAGRIGRLVGMDEDQNTGDKTGKFWIDIRYDAQFPDQFLHSNTRQPLHTDGSYEANAPNISFFYCIQSATFGGATTFLDLAILRDCLHVERPWLLDRLESTPLRFFKGSDSKTSLILNGDKCNWNYYRVEKCDLAEEFQNYLENRIINMGVLLGVRLQPGDAVFFHDQCVLHGRDAFIGNRHLRKGGLRWTG